MDNEYEELTSPFEDEIDCATINDHKFTMALNKINHGEYMDDNFTEDDIVDVALTYFGSMPDTDVMADDVNELIAAERDMAYNPFEEEEYVDAATGGKISDEIDLSDLSNIDDEYKED